MENNIRERRALCGICPAGCWVIATLDNNGKMVSVRADESSDYGIICKLGEHSPEIVYSENRLRTPLRRTGPKGTYDFEPISWDVAFEEITERLNRLKDESGPESTAIYTGRGSFEPAMCDIFQPAGVAVSSASSVLFPFGSPNTMGVGALCYVSYAMIAPHVTLGGMHINMFSDIENADLIVVWGANPATDSPPLDLVRIREAVSKRGAEVIVIDPRRTRTAKETGGRWIPIRSGTDGALALGLCNVLIKEEWYDEAFVRDWTHGFEDFSRYVQHFRPEVVERITGVPADTIRSLAERIVNARGAAPIMYTGLEYSDSGVQAIRATMILWALAGQMDVPGGRCFTMPGNGFPVNRNGLIPNPNIKKALGLDNFPVYSSYRGESHANALPESVLEKRPYPIRGMIVLGASITTSWPQPEIWRKTLNGLDFLACIDINLTADCAFADIVLPAATWYEIESYMRYGPIFRIRERVIPPVGDSRNAFFILAELAERLGYGHLYPQTEDALLRHALKASPFTLEAVREAGGTVQVETAMMSYRKWEKGLLRADGEPGFETPTGKMEIHSTILEDHGYDPLPVYTEPREGPMANPELAKSFPLVFNSGSRVTTDFRSQHHHIPGLVKERPEPTVMMNTKDAQVRNIRNGDAVVVKSPRGKTRLRAIVTDDIISGTIDANMGGGGPLGPEAWQQCNINDLTDLRFDPISGFPIYKALLCDVAPEQNGGNNLKIDSGEGSFDIEVREEMAAKVPARARIYLDHNATTSLDPLVQQEMDEHMRSHFGNPSSAYDEGRQSKAAIDRGRRRVANLLGCTAKRIIFTSGGSEANNLVIKGVAFAAVRKGAHMITSAIEHPSVLNTCKWLEGFGISITYLPVDGKGCVNPDHLEKAIRKETVLISVMTANNETGVVQPIEALAQIARKKGVLFHTDAVQAVGKVPIDVKTLGVDFLSLSSHKFHGPKGVGALYMHKGTELPPLIHGGNQEGGRRAGTENSIGIIGLGKAAELAESRLPEMGTRVARLRDRLENGVCSRFPEARVNGCFSNRLPNTLNLSLPKIRGESMVLALDAEGVSLSAGSACRSGSPKPSHALMAMGMDEEQAHCALRFSMGIHNTEEQIDLVLDALDDVVRKSMQMVRFVSCR